MLELNLLIHGIGVHISSTSQSVISSLCCFFFYFIRERSAEPLYRIRVFLEKPLYGNLPPLDSAFVTPRNACYFAEGVKYVDYSGAGLVVENRADRSIRIYSLDSALLNNMVFSVVLSLVSSKLDRTGLHRVHGLGLAVEAKGALVLLDMGGGKTTLALDLLARDSGIKLISEESPLISRTGALLPLPMGFSLYPDSAQAFPAEYLVGARSPEWGERKVLDVRYFPQQVVSSEVKATLILIGRRTLSAEPKILPATYRQAFSGMFKNSIIGVGLFQGIEFLFQEGILEIFKMLPIAVSRTVNALRLLAGAKYYELYLCPDREKNASLVAEFLRAELILNPAP
jgi:hypothetical protein